MNARIALLLLCGCFDEAPSISTTATTQTVEARIINGTGSIQMSKVHIESEHMTCYFAGQHMSCLADEADGGRR